MKYEYKFRTGEEPVEIDDEWAEVLKDLDHQERRGEYKDVHHTIHYDAFPAVGDYLGKEDADLAAMFDGSPAFEYARKRISERDMEILTRHVVNGESFVVIGASYGITESAASTAFHKNLKRFGKYYTDGAWINSSKNKSYPGIGRVLSIPYKLTPEQAQAIRVYRWQCYCYRDIAQLVGVNMNQVLMCLNENPVMQSVCPTCGKEIHQAYRQRTRVFCSRQCYLVWYNESCNKEKRLPPLKARQYLERPQELVLQYYKQARVSYKRMSKLTHIPLRIITAYFNTNPLPYTICMSCGARIMESNPRNMIKVFCSQKCMDHYHNMEFYYKAYKNMELYPKPTIPPPLTLFMAIEMLDTGYSRDEIMCCTGLSEIDIESLFRYDKADEEGENGMKMINKVVTGSVRIINTRIWEPADLHGTVPLYTATLLIPKDDEKTLAGIRAAMDAIVEDGLRKGGPFRSKAQVELPLRDGDYQLPDGIFHNCFYLNVSSIDAPQVFDYKLNPITYHESFFSGCLARVSLTFYPYWINQKRYGVGCRLGNIQKAYSWEQFEEIPDIAFDSFKEDFTRIFYIKGSK